MGESTTRRRWVWGAVWVAALAVLGVLVATDSGNPGPDPEVSIPPLDTDASAAARQLCTDVSADTLAVKSVSQTTTADGDTYTVQLFSAEDLLATCVVQGVEGGAFELVSLTPAE